MEPAVLTQAERRKQVRLRARPDLQATPQRYEGKQCHVLKDPVSLKYYRFNEQEYFVFQLLDGKNTLDDVQKRFEEQFRPNRLTLEDLESFARQLVTSGLVHHESPNAGKHLFDRRKKQRRMKKLATFTNILYLKIPVFDPDRLLTWMFKYLSWIFTYWFMFLSVGVMLAAVVLVTLKFNVFWEKLPAYNEFFRFRTLLYMWLALGVVKVIHEFGHGLSCKAFRGECHEMGILLMCFSPALYCNVTDSWTVADKWKRIIISFAGIYVELIIASIATFVWWYSAPFPFVNNVALCIMVLCSVTTFLFNANPLMRFDGYYILADWLEVPNLRERANRYLSNQAQDICLGIEVQPEPYMAPSRKLLFLTYAIVSYFYRWIVTFSIVWFLAGWLKPYKLETLSMMLAGMAVFSMIFWPMFRLFRGIKQRGRLPDMKRQRVAITSIILVISLAIFFLLPLPVSRVREKGFVQVQERNMERVFLKESGFLESCEVRDGQAIQAGQVIARYSNPELDFELAKIRSNLDETIGRIEALQGTLTLLRNDTMGTRAQYEAELAEQRKKVEGLQRSERALIDRLSSMAEVKSPRAGVVMSPPKREDIYKFWDKSQSNAICTVGDPTKLRVLVPVTPLDYVRMQENLNKQNRLEVSIHIPGRSDRLFHGFVNKLPETHATDVPVALTSKGGGSLATKPATDPNVNEPLVQTYLVPIEIIDFDPSFLPGELVSVKVHMTWKSAAWWVWQTLASSLDWGLL
jgi:putative peptide zinc metalloprotease protein